MKDYDKLIFDLSVKGLRAYTLPPLDVEAKKPEELLPAEYLRKSDLNFPELSEVDVVRHYTNLSNKNFGVDSGFYPLGSCTMKYNPKINEATARFEGFSGIHPMQSEETVQGALKLMYDLGKSLCEVTGMDEFTLQPAAGAHGEYTGVAVIKKYHEAKGDFKRDKVIVPDSAHGTNPATTVMAGCDVIEIKSNKRGRVDIEALKKVVGDDTCALMLTNPNTVGIFEDEIEEITKIVHDAGGLVYYDGANSNAIMGHVRPGDMGFDAVHLNLHKTFSTPHGGGGPGAGPVGVKNFLSKFLPSPVVEKDGDRYFLKELPDTMGKVKGFWGHFGILVRAYTYILMMGRDGLKKASEVAVLNANYLQALLKEDYNLSFDEFCMHETVLSGLKDDHSGEIKTLDVAKRLLDMGFHPPTVYFPLIVNEALMVEPTETESKETLDSFAKAMKQIAEEARENPDILHSAPNTTIVSRPDETLAARKPVLKYE